ncbi:MAG: OmpA family protein [Treponema sp.]
MSTIIHTFIKKHDWQLKAHSARKAGIAFLAFLFIPHIFHAKTNSEAFVGAGGKFYFPSLPLQTDYTPWFGGGGYLEGGFEFKDFQADISASFAQFSKKERFAGMGEAKIALGASYLIRTKHIARLPAWVNLRPHLSIFADFYSAEFYKSSIGLGENPILFENGVTGGFAPGFFVDFPNLLSIKGQKIVPTVGLEETFRFDRNGGLFTAPVLNAGVRIFPKCPPKSKAIDAVSEPAEFKLPPPKLKPEPEPQPPQPTPEQPPSPQKLPDVPFILFAPNVASIATLPAAQKSRAIESLDEIARILNAYPDFALNILGYAHNISGTDEENEKELLPLSQSRADSVKSELEKRGIAGARLNAQGMGAGSSPLTAGWKNRRVEFELIKRN